MEKFIIQGGVPLSGEIVPAGNKNAALPILAACLLTDEELIIRNVPRIRDVESMLGLLEKLGVKVAWSGENEVRLHAETLSGTEVDEELSNRIRASFLVEGPTTIANAASEPHVQDLARLLTKMGAEVDGIGSNVMTVHGRKKLQGAEHDICPDHIEIASFMALAAATSGELRIRDVVAEDL